MRRELPGKHAFRPFSRRVFGYTARVFWENGYSSVDMIMDVGPRERDLFSTHAKRSGRTALADLRIASKIASRFEPASFRDGCHPAHDEIAIEKRTRNWELYLFARRGALDPDLEMANISPR